ncbi:MAG: hypothetical protein AAF685_10505 [Cyanobacteria bacterium P01_C01_bin.89]
MGHHPSQRGSEQDHIQDALFKDGANIYRMLKKNAHLSLCGSKRYLGKPVDQTLKAIIQTHGACDESTAGDRPTPPTNHSPSSKPS